MSFLDEASKKRRLEDEFHGPAFNMDNDDDDNTYPSEYIGVDELTTVQHKACFACKYINNDSLLEDETYRALMRLYTENSSNIELDATFELVKEFYDSEIKPVLQMDWPLHVIKEHFTRHTNYPTDEILRQIQIKKALREHMINNVVEKCPNGNTKYDLSVMKQITSLEKDILTLLKLKKDIPTMVGYSEILNY
jgi:hypothetical protein